jgi:hypothetical protein
MERSETKVAIKSKRKCRPKDRPRKQAEGSLQDAIQELITLKYKFRWRENKVHGALQMKMGGWINGCGTKGEADMTVYVPIVGCFRSYYIVHLEIKRPGTYQKPEQKAWQELVTNCGEFYKVVRSQEDVENYFKEMGWAK